MSVEPTEDSVDVEEVEKLIADAWAAVDKAGIADEVRGIAFERALDLLVGDSVQRGRKGSSNNDAGGGDAGSGQGLHDTDDDLASKVAAALHITVEQANDLCQFGDDYATADIPPTALTGSKKVQTQDIAVLETAVRTAVNPEGAQWEQVREVADDHGLADGNFSTNVRAAGEYLKIKDEVLTLRAAGRTKAKEIARRVLGLNE